MLSVEQKKFIRGMLSHSMENEHKDAGIPGLGGTPPIDFYKIPDNLTPLLIDMSEKEAKRSVEVIRRISEGNIAFHEQGHCNSCMTGIWVDGECKQCTSQSYPGMYNRRTLADVPTNRERYLDMIGVYLTDPLEADVYHSKVLFVWGDVALQKNIIQFVSDNLNNPEVDVLNDIKIKGQLAIRSRLSNRGIQHSHLNDHQLLKAVWALLSMRRILSNILEAA